jgi:polyhydroxyalkanoate synthesis regulator phasin
MDDLFKLGLGAVDLAREHADAVVKKLERRHGKEMREGRKLLDDALKAGASKASSAHTKVKAAVKDAVHAQDLVEEKDIKELGVAVERLGGVVAKIASGAAKAAVAKTKKAMKTAKTATTKKATRTKRSAKTKKAVKTAKTATTKKAAKEEKAAKTARAAVKPIRKKAATVVKAATMVVKK